MEESSSDRERRILREAIERLRIAQEEDSVNRQEAFEDLEFAFVPGKQWPTEVKLDRIGRPCIEVNKMPTYIDQVVGDQRQNRPSIKVVPVDSDSDPKTANILGGWIKHVLQISQAPIAVDHAFEHAVSCGYGAFRVVTKYNNESSSEQEAYVEKIDNALAVWWGKHSKYDCSDAQYCFVVSDVDREEYKLKYKEEPMSFSSVDSNYIEGWCTEKTVRVCEYFVKEPVRDYIHIVAMANGENITVDNSYDLQEGDQVISSREVEGYKIKWYLLSGNKILDERDWLGKKYIPIIPVWGKEINIGGRRMVRSLIRYSKDAQRMYNYWNCLSLDTPIVTPTGWTTMKDLAVGDKIFDDKGMICSVLNISPVFEKHKCFNILFDDGSTIIADDKHLWTVEERGKRKTKTFDWEIKTITTDQLIPGKHFIPVVEPLELPEQDYLIPPYVLGVWLGDGTSRAPEISQSKSGIDELSRHLESFGCIMGINKIYKENLVARTILGLRNRFVSMDLLCNKHIPTQYLRGSKTQRLELLQGLMDTDGSISATGQCSFTTTNLAIANGFSELLRTLGIKSVCCARDRRNESPTIYKGKKINHVQIAYQFSFTAYSDMPVFRLERKVAGLIKKTKAVRRRTKRHGIKKIIPISSVPVKCVNVDSPSLLYLVGTSMIPTHNSVYTETIALAPKAPYLVTAAQISNHEPMWNTAGSKNHPYLIYNPDNKAPTSLPKRELPPQASSGMAEMLNITGQDIHDTMGLQKASLGIPSNERSGAAIRERKQEGDVGTFAFIDNCTRSWTTLARILIDIAPSLLDTERIIRMGLDDGSSDFVNVNIQTLEGRINDIGMGSYDVVVTTGPSYTTQRSEARESLGDIMQYSPDTGIYLAPEMVDNMDFPGAKRAAKLLRNLWPPDVRAKYEAEEASKNGEQVEPVQPPPQPPPDPMLEIQAQEGMLKAQKLQVEIEQEKVKLEGIQLDNVLKELMVREKSVTGNTDNTV